MELDDEIRALALKNAVKYNGKASTGAVLGKLLSKHPELKQDLNKLRAKIETIVSEVNSLSKKEQNQLLKDIAPELLEEQKNEKQLGLQPLPGAIEGKVVTRAAPNPNGPIHLGSARAGVLSFLYAEKYKGRFILRFDDTSPKTKPPMKEAYNWIIDDFKWLGANISRIEYASKRFERYYEVAQKLIKLSKAYICTCNVNDWRSLMLKCKPCKCRKLPPEEHMKRWKLMFKGYKEGEAVLRIKTDLKHKDPSMRDWWAAKIIDNPDHPITGNKYRVWPSYNIQSAIDDHDFGVTHIIRGQEHSQNEQRQRFVYRYLGWEYPIAIHHGRVILEQGGLSTTKTRELIEKGKYTGWDDPRLITIRAFRRRGFRPEAIRDIIVSVGLNTNDVILSGDRIAAFNRRYIEPLANRYMFVANPVKIEIKNSPETEAKLKFHPDHPEQGYRKIKTHGSFYITERDYRQLKQGKLYRLMDCLNFVKQGPKLIFHSLELNKYKEQGEKIIHWVAVEDAVKVKVLMNDASILNGYGESALVKLKQDDVVQFNRFGFARLDTKGTELFFVYTHN